jgi:prepilin-type N-terminal cleavage/methylation domain-containing protein
MKTPSHRNRGFTLIELLVVAAILLLVSTSTFLIFNDGEDQRRYEDTRERHAVLREALFGPERQTLNGSPIVSGYLADTGALPAVLADLRTQPPGVAAYALIGPAAKGVRLSHGWRGPYLVAQENDLRDAWGNPFYYATPALAPSGLLELASLGKDGISGGTGEYDTDDPSPFTIAAASYEITGLPVPRLRLKQTGASPLTVAIGILRAGVQLTENYTMPDHPSLITAAGGGIYTVTIPAAPGEVQIEAGRTFDLGNARQFQIAFYDPAAAGATLADKLVAAHPQVFTALPRTAWVEPALDPDPFTLP